MSKILLALSCLAFVCVLTVTAQAACRDDCHVSCCGDGGLCQTEEQNSCLVECLKGCGGEDVPAVPEPAPAEPQPEEQPAQGSGSGS